MGFVLIKPLFLCLLFIRAEWEGDWPLNLEAVKNMIPSLYYLRSMETLPDYVHSHFMKEEHTIQLSATPWSGIRSYKGIEVSYNQISKGAAEIIGQSTNMETVKVWAYSLNGCCEVVECLEAMEDKSSSDNMHKKEKELRISHDQVDRDILRKKSELSIDIFDASQHGDELVNVVTGKINNDLSVNVDDSIRLGEDQIKNFQKGLPGGFYDTISDKLRTMPIGKKGMKAGKKIVLDPEVVYARALALRHINPDLNFEKPLVYELGPYPTSMFNERRAMCPCNQKSKLMVGLKVEVSARTVGKPDAFFLDDCAIFWAVACSSKRTIGCLIENFRKYVIDQLKIADVYLILDRYYDGSIKSLTTFNRDTRASRLYHLTLDTPMQSKDVILKVSENKQQLIQLIFNVNIPT